MALLTVIGRGARVRGRVTGDSDLTIEGHVEGEVSVAGDVIVESGGLVGANVTGRTLTVRGAVRGDLTAEEAVRLEDGARVVGDLRAPRIAISKGALVRGLVQTGSAERTAPRASTRAAKAEAPVAKVAPTTTSPAFAPRRAPAPPSTARAAAQPPAKPSPAPTVQAKPPTVAHAPAPPTPAAATPAANHAPAKGPPPPVVPALKKGAKAALKKKAT